MSMTQPVAGILLAVSALMAGVDRCSALAQPAATEPFDKLHRLIAPGPKESQWMQVPWMPSSNIYAARKKAAEEGKPLLLWYMAGEPLGTC